MSVTPSKNIKLHKTPIHKTNQAQTTIIDIQKGGHLTQPNPNQCERVGSRTLLRLYVVSCQKNDPPPPRLLHCFGLVAYPPSWESYSLSWWRLSVLVRLCLCTTCWVFSWIQGCHPHLFFMSECGIIQVHIRVRKIAHKIWFFNEHLARLAVILDN